MVCMGRQPRLPSIPERLARRYAAGMVGRLSFGLLAIVLIPVVAIIGILIFVVLGAVMF